MSPKIHTLRGGTRPIFRSPGVAAQEARRSKKPCLGMVLVRVRIYFRDTILGEPMRPFAAEITIDHVVERELEPLEDVKLETVDVFKDAAETH